MKVDNFSETVKREIKESSRDYNSNLGPVISNLLGLGKQILGRLSYMFSRNAYGNPYAKRLSVRVGVPGPIKDLRLIQPLVRVRAFKVSLVR